MTGNITSQNKKGGAGEQRGWDGEAESSRGLEIDDQLELSWLDDRQIGRLRPF